MSAIIVNNISKHFELSKRGKRGKKNSNEPSKTMNIIRAVDDINFEVKRGEIFGFLGPNGAGKTTTIRMMTGVLRPTEGTIKMLGLDAWKNQISVKQVTGNVPEMANVYFNFTGWENLMFIGGIYGIKKNTRTERAEGLLKKFGLLDKKDLKAMKYSKGMLPKTDSLINRAINISVGVSDAGLGSGFGITVNSDEKEIDKKIETFRNVVEKYI